jgi:hypothetical protein
MKRTTSTSQTTSQPASATAIHTPQLPQDFEKIRQRTQAIYRARGGMMKMTLNDWRKAGLELEQEL